MEVGSSTARKGVGFGSVMIAMRMASVDAPIAAV